MKALLIHVGVDQSEKNAMTLGVNAPIFDDGTFEFIPILEFWDDNTYFLRKGKRTIRVSNGREQKAEACTLEVRTYSSIAARNKNFGEMLSEYIPSEYENAIVHFDPDFEHFTYGDSIATPKGTQIGKLNDGDYIFFVESLAPYIEEAYVGRNRSLIKYYQRGNMAKFVIGYFKVQATYTADKAFDDPTPLLYAASDPNPVNEEVDEVILERIRKNAHAKRDEDQFHIVVGIPSDAAILTRAIRITENGSPFRPSKIGKEIFGNVCYPRGVKWVNESKRIRALLDYCRSYS